MWITITYLILIIAQLCALATSAGEADYTLDDSFWNEESPVGEVERLLKEYRQNQELVRRIGGHYYQIIYPVQLRHHEKMGISTREVSPSKPGQRPRQHDDSGFNRGRTKKHFHRTSLLIKAFNHKFRLDLELNSQLLSPNIQQKHYHVGGYLVDGNRHDIEHCYYHGTVKDYPGASAAFHTCNGVSGVIHIGNETFVIHPFYGGDLSKHPHVIFEARTKANKGCANSGNLDSWRLSRRTKHLSVGVADVVDEILQNHAVRSKRDVREATKYIETAIIVDKAMFDKRNGSTRAEVIHDAIQVANIADLYFRTLNTRVSVVYIETWGKNQAVIDGSKDIGKAISNFNDYTSRNLFQVERDTTQLLTGETFSGGEAGMAVPETVCTPRAVGISVDVNVYEPHLLAGTMAHMIGHNIGMGHDDGREECFCRDWHGCIMAQSIVGQENVQPYKFSECSKKDYIDALRTGHGLCLLNKPNEIELRRNCGNKIVEEDEECDCGTFEECALDPCCDGITCKLKSEAQCASGACCEQCRLRPKDYICRDSNNECDLPEYCDGEVGQCPSDVYKKNGSPCGLTKTGVSGYCFQGYCPTLSLQCEAIWGYGGSAADRQCYEQFNSKGSINGHCGRDANEHYIKCDPENVQCGTLQCKEGERQPVNEGIDQLYSRTIISIKGLEYECKATSGQVGSNSYPEHGLVKDGTPCGDNLICLNQTCVSLFPHVDQTKCPTNKQGQECSEHGVCTNTNRCFCDMGWGGTDCSSVVLLTTALPTEALPTPENTIKMEKKETPYENYHGSNTVFLVGVLMSVVGFVFITFTLMALCYRRKTTTMKYDPPYSKKPIAKSYGGAATAPNHHSVEEVSLDGSSKLVYANQTGFRDKVVHGRRYTAGGEDDQSHAEKGILKKHGYGLVHGEQLKDKWGDDNQSDNLELITQDGTLASTSGGVAASEVERTLKSLNGYHEDILEALRNAATHRGTGTGNTPVGSGSLSEEMLRKTLQDCSSAQLGYSAEPYKRTSGSKSSSRENVCDNNALHAILLDGSGSGLGGLGLGSSLGAGGGSSVIAGGMGHGNAMLHHHRSQHQLHQPPPLSLQQQQPDEEDAPSTGPLRIRNLEDLIRQLEHHSSRHMSPSGSEDIRMSETDADRHYRLDSSAACSESSQGSNQQLAQTQKTATIHSSYSSRCRPRSDEESRFAYGSRYRQPTPAGRHAQHQSHSPHQFGHHSHHSHAHGHATHGPHSSHHSSHTHLHQEDDGLYETADQRNVSDARLDSQETPDSESDDFIQAQQQLARWASEDVVSVVVLDQPQSATISDSQPYNGVGPMSGATTSNVIHLQHPHQHHGDPQSSSAATAAAASNNCIMGLPVVQNGTSVSQRDFYPSPPSTETESSGSAIQLRTRRILQSADTVAASQQQHQLHQLPLYQQHHHQQQQQLQHQSGDTSSSNNSQSGQVIENGCYPEYKH
ncbi:disintegrin and metalloproteinase domain-containing protein unc-71 isoform X4 [Drosophila guanche]|uniref:Blast:Disintegrin and metalloproteinase domain-containing protein 12 n=1 Tax=Drosophila guanche TaxID=7266 RepID=A0A3B0KJ34_DROGU|nr:disintegrin and metalloproteinase domain-containing protein unc-71 isoform X4 [Drosophila guanche]SPP86479.1 blast:Disintegrin and metalloproteinase domain-containing protein 12 [Drosophila guanche]